MEDAMTWVLRWWMNGWLPKTNKARRALLYATLAFFGIAGLFVGLSGAWDFWQFYRSIRPAITISPSDDLLWMCHKIFIGFAAIPFTWAFAVAASRFAHRHWEVCRVLEVDLLAYKTCERRDELARDRLRKLGDRYAQAKRDFPPLDIRRKEAAERFDHAFYLFRGEGLIGKNELHSSFFTSAAA